MLLRVLTLALALLTAYSSRAAVLTEEDARPLNDLYGKAEKVGGDIGAVKQSIFDQDTPSPASEAALDCLEDLHEKLSIFELDIEPVELLVSLVPEIHDAVDQGVAKLYLFRETRAFLKAVPLDRNTIKRTMRLCASSELVAAKRKEMIAAKGQEIVSFYEEAEMLVRAIQGKVLPPGVPNNPQ